MNGIERFPRPSPGISEAPRPDFQGGIRRVPPGDSQKELRTAHRLARMREAFAAKSDVEALSPVPTQGCAEVREAFLKDLGQQNEARRQQDEESAALVRRLESSFDPGALNAEIARIEQDLRRLRAKQQAYAQAASSRYGLKDAGQLQDFHQLPSLIFALEERKRMHETALARVRARRGDIGRIRAKEQVIDPKSQEFHGSLDHEMEAVRLELSRLRAAETEAEQRLLGETAALQAFLDRQPSTVSRFFKGLRKRSAAELVMIDQEVEQRRSTVQAAKEALAGIRADVLKAEKKWDYLRETKEDALSLLAPS